ncbi:hypothetical protein [Gynuella sunshinyii]|uniref:ABC-type amino acid transport/signal transduction system, periplasmic component/domain n=1 Tax=Gynuella sunshinyii YC6258 TaxID=1445510 RepID=A0A0C5VGH7_9GAMM|nr:hypothetical protein [Gynuella sunshinyii]AJQ93276.1 hypothetical Protein YC6258_01228 [Gynuella sunshinyii YC6258]
MIKIIFCVAVLAGIPFLTMAAEETVVTIRTPEVVNDNGMAYGNKLIQLALDKTVSTYGPYRLAEAPRMTSAQSKQAIINNSLTNFVMKTSYTDSLAKQTAFVAFPVDLGIVGYRVCFTSQGTKEKLAQVQALDDLRAFTHGQGTGWADVKILRENGFNVREVSHREGLYLLTAHGSIDLFCRGTNELLKEYQEYKKFPDLTYDETFAIQYPLPRFFFTSKENQDLVKRLDEGIKMAYADGSLQKLWLESYQDSIDFVRLDKRKIFHIQNPLIKDLPVDYQKYMYQP